VRISGNQPWPDVSHLHAPWTGLHRFPLPGHGRGQLLQDNPANGNAGGS